MSVRQRSHLLSDIWNFVCSALRQSSLDLIRSVTRWGYGLDWHVTRLGPDFLVALANQPFDFSKQLTRPYWLRNIAVHTGGEAALLIALQRMSSLELLQ
jgi:hypothetical protein